MRAIRKIWETDPRKDPNPLVYTLLAIVAVIYPIWAQASTGGSGDFLISFLADGGVYVLLAIGLNVVVGFAGLLDLGYAAFFAIGAYTYAFLASEHMLVTPLGMAIHLPFWIVLFIAIFVAAGFGVILGAPTLRLRGDYLAIVTLGFGEIVPQTFQNLAQFTGGPNGISSLDQPAIGAYKFHSVLPWELDFDINWCACWRLRCTCYRHLLKWSQKNGHFQCFSKILTNLVLPKHLRNV